MLKLLTKLTDFLSEKQIEHVSSYIDLNFIQ